MVNGQGSYEEILELYKLAGKQRGRSSHRPSASVV